MADNILRNGSPRLLAAAVLVGFPASQSAADEWRQDQAGESRYLRVTTTGDLATSSSPIPGPLHSNITLGVATGDYFRGAFDGVEEDIDSVSGIVNLSTTYQLVNRPDDRGLSGISITGGSANGLTNGPAANQGDWYESNSHVGLAAEFGGGWQSGLTYTYYAAPDIAGADPLQEVALATGYAGDDFAGRLAPQVKVAKPVDETDGWFTEFSMQPSFDVARMRAGPVTVSIPMAVGVGWDDYYGGAGGDTGVYGSVGGHVGVPLGVPRSYGNWTASVGVDGIFRDNTIQAAGGPLDDAGDVAVIGTAKLSVTF